MVDWPDIYSSWGLERHEIIALNDTGKEFVWVLEKAEQSFGGNDKNPRASDFIRATDYKVSAFERNSTIDPHTKELYEALLEKHLKNINRPITTQSQYLDATKNIFSEFKGLKTKDGERISNTKVDAGMIEGIEAVYDGVSKGLEVTMNELKKQLETLVTPEEWQKIVDSLVSIAKDPIHFMDLLMQWMKTEANEVWKQMGVMWKNSTNSGFSAEMWRYIPETWIPLLIWAVWPWKFFKILWLDKILPESIMKKLSKGDEELNTTNVVDTRSVEKLRALNIRQIQYIFDWEIQSMEHENLRTIFNGIQEVNDWTIQLDRKFNTLSNEWLGSKLWNIDNILTIAVERNNWMLKKDILAKVLLPISTDIVTMKWKWLIVNDKIQRLLSSMTEKAQ